MSTRLVRDNLFDAAPCIIDMMITFPIKRRRGEILGEDDQSRRKTLAESQ